MKSAGFQEGGTPWRRLLSRICRSDPQQDVSPGVRTPIAPFALPSAIAIPALFGILPVDENPGSRV